MLILLFLVSGLTLVIFRSHDCVWCRSNLLKPTVIQKQTEDHFSWYSEPQWICDNRFTCYLHRGLYSQISGISGLTGGDYALYSIHGRSELIMHQYGSKYGNVSWTEVRARSRCINHLGDFLCCQKRFSRMAEEYVTAANFLTEVHCSATYCRYRDNHPTGTFFFYDRRNEASHGDPGSFT